jgi:hypothetical protein
MERLTNPDFRSDVPGFYLRHNRDQTLERARALQQKYAARILGRATMLERFDALAGVYDESDRFLEGMSQLGHALQTANAIRSDGLGEDWIVLGLVHDLGKGPLMEVEPPEFVVGDIHPLGCAFSSQIQHSTRRGAGSRTSSSRTATISTCTTSSRDWFLTRWPGRSATTAFSPLQRTTCICSTIGTSRFASRT